MDALLAAILLFASIAPDIRLTPGSLTWRAGTAPLPLGTEVAILEGVAARMPYTIRVKLPAGTTLAETARTTPQKVTVLSGTVDLVKTGTTAGTFGAGSFLVLHPFSGDLIAREPSIVQISGDHPWLATASMGISSTERIPTKSEKGDLEVLEISHVSGATLTPDTVIRARIRYALRDFRPGAFHVSPMFQSTRGGTFSSSATPAPRPSDPSLPPRPPNQLDAATGTITLEVPVSRILSNPALARPTAMWFFIIERKGDNMGEPILRSSTYDYRVD